MTNFHTALLEFWQQFGLPVFMQGNVPDDQPFPYLTIDVIRPAAMTATVLAAYSWHQRSEATPQPMAERAALLDRIAAAIPESGCVLQFGGGHAVLHRNAAQFQSYEVDADDASVIAGRTSYELTYYGM